MGMKITGLRKAQKLMDSKIRRLPELNEELVAGILIGISQHTRPYVPVAEGALINSEYIITGTSGTVAWGQISYGILDASYGKYVHHGPQRNWQKPGASNKFLKKGTYDFIREDWGDVVKRLSL